MGGIVAKLLPESGFSRSSPKLFSIPSNIPLTRH